MRLRPWVKLVLFIIVMILLFRYMPRVYDYLKNLTIVKDVKNKVMEISGDNQKEKQQKKEYQACLDQPFEESELTENLANLINDLDKYILTHYRMSVKYEDLKTGFKYYYKPEESFYAASTIKLLDGLYLYTKASLNEINLDDTITYNETNRMGASKGMKNHQIGDKIPIRTLVKYAIIYSDNTAHDMLIKYIGFNNLKEFGKSLGATTTLEGGDNFGNINATDAIIYLENTYRFIEENDVLGSELKSFLIEAEENALKYEELNVAVAHKYGEYESYFNDIGIVYDENPYIIAILTTHGNDDYLSIVNDISRRINNIHQQFKQDRQNKCKNILD